MARQPIFFFDGNEFHEFTTERIPTVNTHGTGCTFASAIASYLAHGEPVTIAIKWAKEYVTEAIRASYSIGSGHGPLHHFYAFWK
jgi:hydroxymethylpyrimidine/phosphomethylpyrimidine kinase